MDRRIRPHLGRILLPHRVGRLVTRRLQQVHRGRFPSVCFARPARFVETTDGQNAVASKPFGVHFFCGFLQTANANARDTAMHAREEFGDECTRQANGLEVQTTAIRRDHRDAHLGHDLEQPGINRRAIPRHGLGKRTIDQAALDPVRDTVFREIRVHCCRTTANQNCEVVRIDTFSRPNVQRAERPQPFACQPGVHSACRQNHWSCDLAFAAMLIRQHNMPSARTHGILSFRPDPAQRRAQRALIAASFKRAVDLDHVGIKRLLQAVKLPIPHERAIQNNDFSLAGILIQDILQVPEPRLQAHHPEFAQRVDRRVRDLREILPEVMAQRPIHLGQNSRRGIIAHRRQRLFPVFSHRRKDLLKFLNRVTSGNLTTPQLVAGEQRLFGHTTKLVVQFDNLLDPLAERRGPSQCVLQLGVVEQFAFGHVDRDHLTGTKRAFLDNRRLVRRHHPGFRSRDQQAITGHCVPHRTQTVPIQTGTNPTTIRHRQGRRAVPWLHYRVAVGIHVDPWLRQFNRLLRPAFRYQHRLRHRRIAPSANEYFKNRIERRRIRRPRRNDRLDVFRHLAESTRSHADLMGLHPVDVALQCVDLTIVRQHAEWLRKPPLREGVCRIPLMVDRERTFEPLILQVRIKLRYILRQHHALVDDRPTRQRTKVKRRHLSSSRSLLDPATDYIELALERLFIDTFGIRNQDLFNFGPRRIGFLAEHINIHRHVPPAIDVVPHPQDLGLDDCPACFLSAKISTWQEHLPHG